MSSVVLDPDVPDPSSGEQYPYSNPGLVANQVGRILFSIIGTLLCWVPFRLLYRNGEFAAVVLIVDVVVMNLFTIINSLIWRNDDWSSWWDGTGLCDIEVWLAAPMDTIYAACIFAVMRHLAEQVRLMRVNMMTRHEKKRRNLIEACIVFPIALIQFVFTWFMLSQRYVIGTLVGCTLSYDNSWPRILVYSIPPALYSVLTIPYACKSSQSPLHLQMTNKMLTPAYIDLAWKRFRAVSKTTTAALSTNSAAHSRAQRTRRRLYQMSMSVVVPYVPLQMVLLALNIHNSNFHAYNYRSIHEAASPYSWSAIMLIPSWMLPFEVMNQPWIAILTTIPIVLFFGLTKDAIDMYHRYALAVGLGRFFPHLRERQCTHRPQQQASTSESKKSWLGSLPPLGRRGNARRDSNLDSETNPINPSTPPDNRGFANPYHQAVISSTGPLIPPRHSSLNRGFLFRSPTRKNVPLPVKMPSLPSLRGCKSQPDTDETAVNGAGETTDDDAPMVPLQVMTTWERHTPGIPETVVSLNKPAGDDQRQVLPGEIIKGVPVSRLGPDASEARRA